MKKIAKIIILFLIALALNIVFSNKLYAFEWTTKISQEKILPGDEFYIDVSVDCNALNSLKYNVSTSDPECIEVALDENGNLKTEDISDGGWTGNWRFKIFLKAKKAGKANIKIELRTKSFLITWDKKETNLEVTIGKSAEQEEAEKSIKNGEEILNNLDNAHMTIPSADADAEEINIFIKSESSKSGSKFKNKEIDKETANKWYETLNKAQIDNISRLNYQPQKDVLNEYINCLNEKDNNLDDRIKKSAEAAKATEEANKEAIKNAKIKLAAIAGSSGTSRTDIVFKDDVLDDPSKYNPSNSSSADDSEAATIIDKILSLITTVGTVVSVLMLAILGVKYMLGSVEEKAEYKKDLIPYFIGSILLFGICTIVKILQTLGNSINNL